MPEVTSLTVSAPLPSETDPLPERTNPLLRLMDVPLMVPWQLTGSLIVPVPPKPWPANTVERRAGRVGQAHGGEMAEAGRRVESGRHDQQRVGADVDGGVAKVFPSAAGQIEDARCAASEPGLLPPSKTP